MAKTAKAAANRQPAITGEVIDAGVVEERQLAATDGSVIVSWLNGLAPFFTQALALEQDAAQMLEDAKVSKVPTNATEDERSQRGALRAREAIKAVNEHWEISKVVTRFRNRLTARRGRAEEMLAETVTIHTRNHNQYSQAEQRRVDEENRRREEQGRKDQEAIRARDLAAIETAALEAEAEAVGLSEREQAFVTHYLTFGNPLKAAQLAGYKQFAEQSKLLIERPKIIKAIDSARQAAAIRQQAEALKQQPLDPVEIYEEKPRLGRAAHDVVTWECVIDDVDAFRKAVLENKHGIPLDTLEPAQTVLNRYVRDFGAAVVDRWPGVHSKKKTGVR